MFQLDENFNDKRFSERCNSGGKTHLLNFPKKLIGTKDPELLPVILKEPHPFLTLDKSIVYENANYIPDAHSGIIVVKSIGVRVFTTKHAANCIEIFKRSFPQWADTDWSRLYLEITEIKIYMALLANGRLTNGSWIDFSSDNFVEAVHEKIHALKGN